jgi:hypothetical protein
VAEVLRGISPKLFSIRNTGLRQLWRSAAARCFLDVTSPTKTLLAELPLPANAAGILLLAFSLSACH